MLSIVRNTAVAFGCLLLSACIHHRNDRIDTNPDPAAQTNAEGFTASLGELYAATRVRIPRNARLQGYYNEDGNNKYILASFRLNADQVNEFLADVPYPPRKPTRYESAWLTGEEIENSQTWWFPHLLDESAGNRFQIGQWSQFTYQIERRTEGEYSYLFIRVIDAR